MKFNLQMTLAAVAVFAVAYHMGKRSGGGAGHAQGSVADPMASPADWWSFAGSWNLQ
jgi:hypothetical protein